MGALSSLAEIKPHKKTDEKQQRILARSEVCALLGKRWYCANWLIHAPQRANWLALLRLLPSLATAVNPLELQLNRKFTFRSSANVAVAMLKVVGYYCIFTPTTTLLGNWLAEGIGWNEYLVTAINMLLNLSTEYLFQRYVVYRNKIDNNKAQ